MTEPLVNSALAQFMYKNLLSPETVSWEQFDYCKGLQHVLQPLSSSFAKTSSSTIRILHSRKSLLGSWIASRLSLTSNNLFDFPFMILSTISLHFTSPLLRKQPFLSFMAAIHVYSNVAVSCNRNSLSLRPDVLWCISSLSLITF